MGLYTDGRKIRMRVVVTAVLMMVSFSALAQRAVGLRVGGGSSFIAEFSYQFAFQQEQRALTDTWWQRITRKTTLSPISAADRIEFGLGFGSTLSSSSESVNYMNFCVVYQWHNALTRRAGWYVGPGAYLSFHQFDERSLLALGIGGQLGVDYTFRFPLQVSADFRPMIRLIGGSYGLGWGIAIGCRYMIDSDKK